MEYEIKPKEKFNLGISELWQYRELFYFFTWRDIKVKYKQTILGFFWAILQPFLMMLIFTFFFSKVFDNNSILVPYPVFVYCGLIIWNIFSGGISGAGNSMVSNTNIIKKIYFPRLIIPVSSVLVSLFDFLMTLVIFTGMLIYYDVNVSFLNMIVFIPLGIILALIATLGLGTLLAALNIKYRDFRYIIPFMIQAMLFLTPVIYPITTNNLLYKYAFSTNPMYAAVELFRHSVTNAPLEINLIAVSICSSILLLFTGFYYFRKTENYFADIA